MFQSPSYYDQLLKTINNYASEREAFSQTSNIVYPKAVLHTPDVGTGATESRMDSLAAKLSELTLLVDKGHESDTDSRAESKPGSYCHEFGKFAISCPKNPHQRNRCSICSKLGSFETSCFIKKKVVLYLGLKSMLKVQKRSEMKRWVLSFKKRAKIKFKLLLQ